MTRTRYELPIKIEYGLVPNWLPTERADSLYARVLEDMPPRLDETRSNGSLVDDHRWVGDRYYAERVVPELVDLADTARATAQAFFDTPILPSPFPRSAITVIVYGPGDWKDFHYDSNSVTALLVLGGESEGARTWVAESNDAGSPIRPVDNSTGGLLVFDGKNVRHGVLPVTNPTPRVTVVFNLYLDGDVNRPVTQDEKVYGN